MLLGQVFEDNFSHIQKDSEPLKKQDGHWLMATPEDVKKEKGETSSTVATVDIMPHLFRILKSLIVDVKL